MNFLLLLVLFAIPIISSFLAARFKILNNVKPVLLATGITGIVFALINGLYHFLGVVIFAPGQVSGLYVAGMPIEQLLLCFVLPYSFILIYLYLNSAFRTGLTDKYSLSVSNVVMGLSIAMIFFAYSKWHPLITFSILLLLLFYIEYMNRIRFMLQFYRSFLIALALFLLIYIPLNAFGLIRHDVSQTIELNLAFIPFESYFGFLELGLTSILLLELFKRKT
jgi:hypothetical protein